MMSSNGATLSTTEGDLQTKECRPPPSSGVDASEPTAMSSARLDIQTCDYPGCERIAEERQALQDGTGRIDRVCADHKRTPVMIATAVTRAAHCEVAGCDRTPRYGPQNGPLSFCQAHKRAGQYTVRNGQLFVATRDGSAFRDNPGTTAVDATAAAGVGPASAGATAPPHDTNSMFPALGSAEPTRQLDKTQKKKKKNRPCVFPGCETRPNYGLPGGRGLFCVTHKQDGMIYLQRASKKLEKEAQSRARLKSGLHVADSKPGLEPQNHKETTAAAAEKNVEKQKDRERSRSARNTGGHARKGSAESKSSAPKELVPEEPTQAEEQKYSIMPPPAPAGLPPSGLAPSDEIRLFQEARASARAAAEASGSGRRPRAPSRKLLEASGKLTCDSIQWMTKEKREEEARFKLEMKEQRKAAAAAGLKFGHRIEALALSTHASARAEGDGARTTGGEIAGAGAWTGIKAVVWRKLTPAETLIAAGKQPSVGGAQLGLPDIKVKTPETAAVATMGAGKQEEPTSVGLAAAAKPDVPERKRKAVGSAGESTKHAQAPRKSKHSRQTTCRVERRGSKGRAEEGASSSSG